MPPCIENPYCYIVTKLQCDVTKKTYFKFCGFLKKYYFCNRNEL